MQKFFFFLSFSTFCIASEYDYYHQPAKKVYVNNSFSDENKENSKAIANQVINKSHKIIIKDKNHYNKIYNNKSENLNSRLLSNLTSGREFAAGSEKRTGAYTEVDSSTSSKLPAEAEFKKTPNKTSKKFNLEFYLGKELTNVLLFKHDDNEIEEQIKKIKLCLKKPNNEKIKKFSFIKELTLNIMSLIDEKLREATSIKETKTLIKNYMPLLKSMPSICFPIMEAKHSGITVMGTDDFLFDYYQCLGPFTKRDHLEDFQAYADS